MAIHVEPGTIVLYSDVACGWATLALHRFYAARADAGLDDAVRVDHRLFLLEDVNRFPLPKTFVEGEIPVFAELAPEVGWQQWAGDPAEWPVTSLLANEAVHAAKAQGLAASEELDLALRRAFFAESRTISMLHEILDVAAACPSVDADSLRDALDDGRARGQMMRDYRANRDAVEGSPHFFLADGSAVHNPGIEMHLEDDVPVVDTDDEHAAARLVRQAAGL
ncbi:DsbA family oxidoreductase [Georgenia sp. H159]|uniref:DsbA family oxidoreductase n=1 Tax=Georgenia sp. H159 TaxID=3076115 RepID=UPI002D79ECBA|nr:DsbA family protein [Georgenia sp. H159]